MRGRNRSSRNLLWAPSSSEQSTIAVHYCHGMSASGQVCTSDRSTAQCARVVFMITSNGKSSNDGFLDSGSSLYCEREESELKVWGTGDKGSGIMRNARSWCLHAFPGDEGLEVVNVRGRSRSSRTLLESFWDNNGSGIVRKAR